MHVLFFLGSCLALSAASQPSPEAQKELDRFEGTWQMVDGEKEGQKLAPEHIKAGKIRWHKGHVSVDTPHQSNNTIEADPTVHPNQSPKQMDWVRSIGPGQGQTFHAIYEWISDDQYRVCFAPPGHERPKEFATKPGSGQMLHVWKRVRP
jgi:uncharacterized protein (TIGR03067 family)